jgi:hypothetical protein
LKGLGATSQVVLINTVFNDPVDERKSNDHGIENVVTVRNVIFWAESDNFKYQLSKENPCEKLVSNIKKVLLLLTCWITIRS